jgi:hypothetical protein
MKPGNGLVVLAALSMAACTQSLEQVVDSRHQARIEAANANQPLVRGAADGLGRRMTVDYDADKAQAAAGN